MTSADRDLHRALGIDDALLTRAKVHRVHDRDARDLLGLNGKAGNFAGLVYPYLNPDTGRTCTLRIRVDAVGMDDAKYRSPYGDARHLYFPPGTTRAQLDDVTLPVAFVEAEKSCLAITAAAARAGRRLLVVALGGCWNWKGRIGKVETPTGARVDEKGPLPDFHRLHWTGREAIVLFDARPNESVRAARQQFARVVRAWGADVKHAHLPDDDGRVNGPDDVIRWQGDAALWAVLDRAQPEAFARDAKTGAIIATSLDNIRIALAKLGAPLHYDAFRGEVWLYGSPADDLALDRLWVQIDDTFHFRPSKDTLQTVLTTEAHARAVHPVRHYLDGLVWDGTRRLDTWLTVYGGAEDTPYTRAVGALPLLAAVRRVRRPGCKFDELLILESPQGTMKSSALRALCPDDSWFSDDLPLGVDSKLVIERTAGRWIIEAAELHGNRGREAEQLKSFLSRQVDGPVRLAYGRLPTTVPRQFVLIGTTNSRLAYLKDHTGARRFWPVAVRTFDVDALTRDRDQLWAEAATREAKKGTSIRLASDLWEAAGEAQEERRACDPWEETLAALFDGDGLTRPAFVSVDAIWDRLGMEANQLDNRHADRVAAILQRHGFTKTRRRILAGGPPVRCWERDQDEEA